MDFIDAMIILVKGGKVTRKKWNNAYWEKINRAKHREKYTGEATCAGSILFEFTQIADEEKEATDWEAYNE